MIRGEIWTVAGGSDFMGKPRPAVIVQDWQSDVTNSLTICPVTTDRTEASSVRVPIDPSDGNGLRDPCRVMIDKITTVRKSRFGVRIGRFSGGDMSRLDLSLAVFLGLGWPLPPSASAANDPDS